MIKNYIIQTPAGADLVKCPGSWDDISTGLYIDIIKKWKYEDGAESVVKLFAIVTGKNFKALYDSTDANLEAVLDRAIGYIYRPGFKFDELPVPKFLKYFDKKIEIPQKLGALTLGQNLQMRKAMGEVDDLRELVAHAAAIYLQPLIDDKPFDMKRVAEIEEQIKLMPILDIYPIGFFFLRQRASYGSSRLPLLPRLKAILNTKFMQRKQELKSFSLIMTLALLLSLLSALGLTLMKYT